MKKNNQSSLSLAGLLNLASRITCHVPVIQTLAIIIAFAVTLPSNAQTTPSCDQVPRMNNWVLYNGKGVNMTNPSQNQFLTNSLTPSPSTVFNNPPKTSSSISDINGNLLFYTNGIQAWGANNQLITESVTNQPVSMLGAAFATNGTLIVPHPTNTSIYYIFTTRCEEDYFWYHVSGASSNARFGLRVYTIQMINGTPKFINPGFSNNNPVLASSSEHLTAVIRPDRTGYWVIAHDLPVFSSAVAEASTNTFKVFNIDSNTPTAGGATFNSYLTTNIANYSVGPQIGGGCIRHLREPSQIIPL